MTVDMIQAALDAVPHASMVTLQRQTIEQWQAEIERLTLQNAALKEECRGRAKTEERLNEMLAQLYAEKLDATIAAEREACARVADDFNKPGSRVVGADKIAAAIRARKD